MKRRREGRIEVGDGSTDGATGGAEVDKAKGKAIIDKVDRGAAIVGLTMYRSRAMYAEVRVG